MEKAAWESNSSSSACTLCLKKFGRLVGRRHHCRHCGRLVCQSCSSQRLSLPASSSSSSTASLVTPNSGSSKEGHGAVRVCDPCFLILTAKEEQAQAKSRALSQKQEQVKLSSYLSSSLLRLFFLDGHHKTFCYDESTTIAEIASQALPSASVALFRCEEDLDNPSHYTLLRPQENVFELLLAWKESPGVKIVLPTYHPASTAPLPASAPKLALKEEEDDDDKDAKEDFATRSTVLKVSSRPLFPPVNCC